MELHAKYTLFAEGARGSLTKKLRAQFDLEANCEPQVYGLGVKELWDVPAEKHKPGRVIHSQGWPLEDAWGGGFLYHQENSQVALGFVVAAIGWAASRDCHRQTACTDGNARRGRRGRTITP